VIVKIQAEVIMKRIRIREFFKDYDNLRKGIVSESQVRMGISFINDLNFRGKIEIFTFIWLFCYLKFRRVLDVSNINVTQGEIALLLKEFKVDNIPNG